MVRVKLKYDPPDWSFYTGIFYTVVYYIPVLTILQYGLVYYIATHLYFVCIHAYLQCECQRVHSKTRFSTFFCLEATDVRTENTLSNQRLFYAKCEIVTILCVKLFFPLMFVIEYWDLNLHPAVFVFFVFLIYASMHKQTHIFSCFFEGESLFIRLSN